MEAIRVKVVPPFRRRGLIAAPFLLGAAYGEVFFQAGSLLTHSFGGPPPRWFWIALTHALVLPPVLLGIVLANVTQRSRRLAVAGAALGAGFFIELLLARALSEHHGGADLSQFDWTVSLALLIAVGGAAAITLGVGRLVGVMLFSLVEQDGSRCGACGYQLGAPGEPRRSRCPECGSDPAQPVRVPRCTRLARGFLRAGRPALSLALLVTSGLVGWRVATVTIPASRFLAKFGANTRAAYAYIDGDQHLDRRYTATFRPALGRLLQLDPVQGGGQGRALLIAFDPSAPAGAPAMQVRVVIPPGDAASGTLTLKTNPDWGDTTIVIDLTHKQARHVLRHGIPPGLVQALLDKANDTGWAPEGTGRSWSSERITVDADPHFK